jgi:DNA-binding transcriptional MerR regulator
MHLLNRDDTSRGDQTKERGMSRKLITAKALRKRYADIHVRTVDRWVEAGILPQPMRINNVRFWDETEIEQLERERMAKALKTLEAA